MDGGLRLAIRKLHQVRGIYNASTARICWTLSDFTGHIFSYNIYCHGNLRIFMIGTWCVLPEAIIAITRFGARLGDSHISSDKTHSNHMPTHFLPTSFLMCL